MLSILSGAALVQSSMVGAPLKKRVTILSIDGGGLRGIIPAKALELLETSLQALDGPDARVADYFDIIAGNSSGGIITLMLAAPNASGRPMFTTQEITKFFMDNALSIFPQDIYRIIQGLTGPKYSPAPLEKLFKDHFYDLQMHQTLSSIVVPAFDTKIEQPVFFSTLEARINPLKNAYLRDVGRATSAAPTFFPPMQFTTTDQGGNSREFNLVDGGVAVNNPTFLAITHMQALSKLNAPKLTFQGSQDVLILSLGTGSQTVSYDAEQVTKWSPISWIVDANAGPPIINMLLNASSDLVDYNVSVMFEAGPSEENYLRLQTRKLQGDTAHIDNASPDNMQKLVQIAEELLNEPVQKINMNTGELEPIPGRGTNREAILKFAKLLSEEHHQLNHKGTSLTT